MIQKKELRELLESDLQIYQLMMKRLASDADFYRKTASNCDMEIDLLRKRAEEIVEKLK